MDLTRTRKGSLPTVRQFGLRMRWCSMSKQLIDRSSDLSRLRADGYDIAVDAGYLFVRDIPYLDSRKAIQRGVLISTLKLAGDVTARPDTHVAYFHGLPPCNTDGSEIEGIKKPSKPPAGIAADLTFSAKPSPS